MSSTGASRCVHELLPGQCAACAEVKKATRVRVKHGGRAATPQMRRLIDALRAEHRGRNKSKAERKVLAERVRRAEASLSKTDRRLAREKAAAPHGRASVAREQRIFEDKLAGIHTPWVTPQNVGRGKRS